MPVDNYISLPYPPKSAVVITYGLFGGSIGGGLLGVIFCLTNQCNSGHITIILFTYTLTILGFSFYGLFLGFLPAIITGTIISWNQSIIDKLVDYLYIFTIGFSISFLYGLILLLPLSYNNIYSTLTTSLILGISGGITAMILGEITLPKTTINLPLIKE